MPSVYTWAVQSSGGRSDLIPFSTIALGEGGLPRCDRCPSTGSGVAFRESTEIRSQIDGAVRAWTTVPGPNLVLGGAEAFAHPELPALVGYAARASVGRIALETGGGPLTVGENAAGALHVGVRHVRVHYVPRAEGASDTAPFTASACELALAGIRAFLSAAEAKNARVAVSAIVPVCRHTAALLPAAVAELAAAGVGAVRLVGSEGGSFGPALIAHVTAACDTGTVNGVWVGVSGIHLPKTHDAHIEVEEGL